MGPVVVWFSTPGSKASAHYCIDKGGKILQFVPVKHIAYHAGESEWKGKYGLNRYSIGIELVNENTGSDPYPEQQMNSCLTLCYTLCKLYGLSESDIITHKDCAPSRKSDPAGFDVGGFKKDLLFYLKEA